MEEIMDKLNFYTVDLEIRVLAEPVASMIYGKSKRAYRISYELMR